MATRTEQTTIHPELIGDIPVEDEARAYKARYLMATTRLAIGSIFAWAFFDKLFGLGFATTAENAWINGGSPTYGYLNFATEGKVFGSQFAALSSPAADWLFMIGLLGIGLALMLGIGMRIAAASGATMLGLMWLASFRIEHHPFVDDHLIYAIVVVALAVYGAGRTWGLGRRWEELAIVKRFAFLK